MAEKKEFNFPSSDGQTEIHSVVWLPESGKPRAVLQIAHGMMEFIERYEEFAEFMTKHGFLVAGHDHLGHGKSLCDREDLGYIAEKNGSGCLTADMHRLRIIAQKHNPDLPYFMLGHSMGSYLLRQYLTVHGEGLAGALILGTGSVPDGIVLFGMALAEALAKARGWRHRSALMERAFFSGAYHKFDMDGSHPENSWLTRDTEIVRRYYEDPRCRFQFTLNGFRSVLEAVHYDNQEKFVRKIPKDLPIILLSGAQDPVGDLGKGVKKVEKQLRKAGILDLTCVLYPEDRHEILNELDKDQVYADILAWCERVMEHTEVRMETE